MMPIHYALSNSGGYNGYYYGGGVYDLTKRAAKIEVAKLLMTKLQNPPLSLLNELLYLATQFGEPSIVKQLIDLGAQMNDKKALFGITPLHGIFKGNPLNQVFKGNRVQSASEWPEQINQAKLATLKVLIASGANLNATGTLFTTDFLDFGRPLHCAVKLRWFEAIEVLLASGAKFQGKLSRILTMNELDDAYDAYRRGNNAEQKSIREILVLLMAKSDSLPEIPTQYFTMAKNTNDIELMKIIYPYEICRNLSEENLLQARVKAAFKHLIQQGWISEYQYEWILKCKHSPLLKDYLHILGAQLLAAVKETEKVPPLKKLTVDYILQNPELFSKQDLEKLTCDLKAELKKENTSMLPLTLSYPIVPQRSWQELRARHRQRQQNNPYDDESTNANDNIETEIKIKIL